MSESKSPDQPMELSRPAAGSSDPGLPELLADWYRAERADRQSEAERALHQLFDLGLPLLAPSAGFSARMAGLLAHELSPWEPSLAERLADWARHSGRVVAGFIEQWLERRWFRLALASILLVSSLFFAAAMAGVGVVTEADPDQLLVTSSSLAVFAVEALASLLTLLEVLGHGLVGVVSTVATPKSLGVVTLLTLVSAMALYTLIRLSEEDGGGELS